MTQPVYPFPLVWPNGIRNGSVVTSAEFEQLQRTIAALADGRLFTDLAVVKNWTHATAGLPSVPTPNAVCFDPVSARWLIGGTTGTAASFSWTRSGARWVGQFSPGGATNNVHAIATDGNGVILAGIQDDASSDEKILESTNGGDNWIIRHIGASDASSVRSIVYMQSLGLWLASKNGPSGTGAGIWSSVDRVTWTKRTGVTGALVARQTPARILVMGAEVPGAGNAYSMSDDGINWSTFNGGHEVVDGTARPVQPGFPSDTGAFRRGFWSDYYGKFFLVSGADLVVPGVEYVVGKAGIYSSPDGLPGTWTFVSPFASAGVTAFGRVIMRGDGKASIDGGANWVQVTDLDPSNTTVQFHAVEGRGVVGIDGASDEALVSTQVGF